MSPIIWLLPIVASCLGAPENRTEIPDGKIVGGRSANILEYPYQLSLQYHGKHICGASIIGERWAVTAAHCTYGMKASDLSVRSGSSYREYGGQVVKVAMIFQNSKFDYSLLDSDISILLLQTEIRLGPGSAIIRLIDDNAHIPEGSTATITGWGTLQEGGSLPGVLQVVHVPIVDHHLCNMLYGRLTDNMICAGFMEGGRDACQGDSGGPLVVNGVLAGIVSFGEGCAEAYKPGVYTNLSAMRGYIRRITGI